MEEKGSLTLHRFVKQRASILRSDGDIWETGYVSKDGRPLIYLGFKGMLYIELEPRGAARDVHSGFASIIPNLV
ncbi:MAG: hypothetical protein DRO39_04120 [Thermoprotei archaeon]|nr:MAG: hypothetical protein DRO39_04120 [Thermoprotei archaeon]